MMDFNQIFPSEIISDILSRLPAESVLDYKSVCTTWKSLIQQPSFPQMHLARLNHPDSADSSKLRYVFLDARAQLFYFEYNNENEDWNNAVKPIRRKFNTGTLELYDYVLIGSFNGLVCVYGTQDHSCDAIIINPVTNEYISLPVFDGYYPVYETNSKVGTIQCYHLACGFGYLAETNEYKVVRLYKAREPNAVEVAVYTVGSGKGWRHVGKFDLGFTFYTHGEHTHGVFLNGCLHWRMLILEGGMVVVFDLAEEKFRDHIPPPPLLTYEDEDEEGNMVLGVSNGGILYYTVSQFQTGGGEDDDDDDEEEEDDEEVNVVWLLMRKDNDNHVMRGQEKKESWVWSKPISLEQTEPFAFKKQDNFLRFDQGNIKEFSPGNSTWTNLEKFSEISRRVFPHKHTLISLKDLGEEDANIMEGLELTMEDYWRMRGFDSDCSDY